MKYTAVAFVVVVIAIATLAAQNPPRSGDQQRVAKNIATFDDLDFNVFTHQKWDELRKSHSKDIVVHWPDGHQTNGIEKHIEDLKAMFVYAPDTRIQQRHGRHVHEADARPERQADSAHRQSVQDHDGDPITLVHSPEPNLTGCAQGTMDEEYLFWDNATYMTQIGLGK
jgi:hypothetical protein